MQGLVESSSRPGFSDLDNDISAIIVWYENTWFLLVAVTGPVDIIVVYWLCA